MQAAQNESNSFNIDIQDSLDKALMYLKFENNDNSIKCLDDRLSLLEGKWENAYFLNNGYVTENKQNNIRKRLANYYDEFNNTEIKQLINRALEIMAEWEDNEDIKLQVQYAAVIVGKIDNIKQKEVIRRHEVKNKIFTLMRNVIRLNVTEMMFTKEHISLLKSGFIKAAGENVMKEELLQLNRQFRKAGLQTMPAWE